MEDLVRVAIERELVEGGVHHGDPAEDGGARPDDSVVEKVVEGELLPRETGDCQEVLGAPDLLH